MTSTTKQNKLAPSVARLDGYSNHLFEGDCLSLMPRHLPSASIDLVLCDLPYGTTRNRWDSLIDLECLWKEYRRVLKPEG